MINHVIYNSPFGPLTISYLGDLIIGIETTANMNVNDESVSESITTENENATSENDSTAAVRFDENEHTLADGQDSEDDQVLSAGQVPDDGQVPCALTDLVIAQLDEYFAGERKTFDFPMALYGTEFQKTVWKALCAIPYGETRTYGQIASAIGNPRASRAVGMANNRNPISIVVPCHRVIGANGSLVGYGGGLAMKEGLLALEKKYS